MIEAIVLNGTYKVAAVFCTLLQNLRLETILSQRSTDNPLNVMLGLCSDMHCQLWDLLRS